MFYDLGLVIRLPLQDIREVEGILPFSKQSRRVHCSRKSNAPCRVESVSANKLVQPVDAILVMAIRRDPDLGGGLECDCILRVSMAVYG